MFVNMDLILAIERLAVLESPRAEALVCLPFHIFRLGVLHVSPVSVSYDSYLAGLR